MENKIAKQPLLRAIPQTNELIELLKKDFPGLPHQLIAHSVRTVLEAERRRILEEETPRPPDRRLLLQRALEELKRRLNPSLRPVINATGVVIHTNLGRSLLPKAAIEEMLSVADRYSNLEFNLEKGQRGSRYAHVEEILCELTGAEAALVVNNNAAAVLITLETLARDQEVIVSRGELVEIGGSFRIPDVMARSGAILREVGTTNRTHLRDYEAAIGPETALLMKVHRSNFQIVGFTKEVSSADLAQLAHSYDLPAVEDLGSGCFIDFSRYGLLREPTVQEILKAGVDVVTFSGDKLMGGPQAGIILGRADLINKIKKNPINRAVRIDKLTLAALEATLRLYRHEATAIKTIPTLRLLTMTEEEISRRARRLLRRIRQAQIKGAEFGLLKVFSQVGGGALPLANIPSRAIFVRSQSHPVVIIEERLRRLDYPIVARIEEEVLLLDVRTIKDEEFPFVVRGLKQALEGL
ncbi:L-seryl-tRNA(Sec) selenium transferase [Thermosulfuriphilus sp.]